MFERADLFTMIHKGIRAMLYDLGLRLQGADFSDAAARESLLKRLEHDLDMMDEHARHEDELIFPAIARFEAGTLQVLDAEHMEIYRCAEAIRSAIRAARAAGDTRFHLANGASLSRTFNEFLAMQCLHMNHEEGIASEALWRHYDNNNLEDMRRAIAARQSTARYAEWARWMLPACSDPELVRTLGGMAANASPPVRDRMFALAESVLGKERWTRIRAGVAM